MRRQEVYDNWKERKGQIDVSRGFTDGVLNRVYRHEQKKGEPFFDMERLGEIISGNTLAKAALVAGGAAVGLVRVAFVVCAFFEALM